MRRFGARELDGLPPVLCGPLAQIMAWVATLKMLVVGLMYCFINLYSLFYRITIQIIFHAIADNHYPTSLEEFVSLILTFP